MAAQDPWLRDPDDYYELLAVDRNDPSFEAAVKSAYSHFAQLYHPDRHSGASAERKAYYERMFKRGTDARDVLLNTESRGRYNEWLDAGGLAQARGQSSSSSRTDGATSSSSSDSQQTWRGQQEHSSHAPPSPHLVWEPTRLDFDTVPAGQPAQITLQIRNAGGPCTDDLFRIRSPRHPAHPNHDPNHWLTVSEPQPWPSPTLGPIVVHCEAQTTRLAPGTYTADVLVDYCGDTSHIPAHVTKPVLQKASYTKPLLAAAGVLALSIILVAIVKSASSGNTTAPQPATAQQPNAAVLSAPVQPASAPPPPPPVPSTPTPPPDTPPGTLLEVGSPWKQDGFELSLTAADLRADGLAVHFQFSNRRPNQIITRYTVGETITVIDNRGRRFATDHFNDGAAINHWDANAAGDTISLTLASNQSLGPWGNWNGDMASPSVTEVIVTVNGISSITNARWRIPVYH
jgi:DnaJ domain